MSVVVSNAEGTWPACVDAALARAAEGEEIVLLYVYEEPVAETVHGAFAGLRGCGHPWGHRPAEGWGRDPGTRVEPLAAPSAGQLLQVAADRLGRPCTGMERAGRVEHEVLVAAQGADLLVCARDGDPPASARPALAPPPASSSTTPLPRTPSSSGRPGHRAPHCPHPRHRPRTRPGPATATETHAPRARQDFGRTRRCRAHSTTGVVVGVEVGEGVLPAALLGCGVGVATAVVSYAVGVAEGTGVQRPWWRLRSRAESRGRRRLWSPAGRTTERGQGGEGAVLPDGPRASLLGVVPIRTEVPKE